MNQWVRLELGELMGVCDGSVLGADGCAVHAVFDAVDCLAVQARHSGLHEGHMAKEAATSQTRWQEARRQALTRA